MTNKSEVEIKEGLVGREIFRLLDISRNPKTEDILDAALDGREKTVESVSKLYNFVLRHFGDFASNTPDTVVAKFWNACSEFLTASGWTTKQLDELRNPYPKAGEPGFRSILDEMREEGRY
jgi:hypothetical protein